MLLLNTQKRNNNNEQKNTYLQLVNRNEFHPVDIVETYDGFLSMANYSQRYDTGRKNRLAFQVSLCLFYVCLNPTKQ